MYIITVVVDVVEHLYGVAHSFTISVLKRKRRMTTEQKPADSTSTVESKCS